METININGEEYVKAGDVQALPPRSPGKGAEMRFDAKETAERLRGASADGCVNKSIIAAFLGDLPAEECRSWKCPACGRMALDVIAEALDPRDTQERIDEDALKLIDEYWGCCGKDCDECPVTIDGKTPYQRYGLDMINCNAAKTLDLLRRQRELDGRES